MYGFKKISLKMYFHLWKFIFCPKLKVLLMWTNYGNFLRKKLILSVLSYKNALSNLKNDFLGFTWTLLQCLIQGMIVKGFALTKEEKVIVINLAKVHGWWISSICPTLNAIIIRFCSICNFKFASLISQG